MDTRSPGFIPARGPLDLVLEESLALWTSSQSLLKYLAWPDELSIPSNKQVHRSQRRWVGSGSVCRVPAVCAQSLGVSPHHCISSACQCTSIISALQEVEAGGSEVQSHPWLPRPAFLKTNKQTNNSINKKPSLTIYTSTYL